MTRKLKMQKRVQHAMSVGDGHKTMTPTLPAIEYDPVLSGIITSGAMALQPGTRAFWMGKVKIYVSPPSSQLGWHMSISHPQRYPTWDEIAKARYMLIPDDAQMVMHLPPRREYVAIHNFCFHLFELRAGGES